MNQETANYIMQRMSKYLDNSQMIKLKDTLDESLRQSEDGILEKSSQELLDMFLATKRLEGRSEKTLLFYRFNIEKMHEKSDKNVCVMNTDDIRGYEGSLAEYEKRRETKLGRLIANREMPILKKANEIMSKL